MNPMNAMKAVNPMQAVNAVKAMAPMHIKPPKFLRKSLSKGDILDGKKIQKLLENEPEFDKFLDSYFNMLDEDKSGKLTREEMKPALVRFGELLGLPPAGTTAEADEMVDRMFTTLMSDNLRGEVDRKSFISISKEFLRSMSAELQAKPVVVEVYDGAVLRELIDNREQFSDLVNDIFSEFDADGSGSLTRLELKPALVSLGLVPPSSKFETDALISRVVGKYGGQDMVVDRKEFELMLRDLVSELEGELNNRPIILSAEEKPVFTGKYVRGIINDPAKMRSMSAHFFKEWDILHRGRLSRSEIAIGFKKFASSFQVQLLSPFEAGQLCDQVFTEADADESGFVERDEFEAVLKALLQGMARKLDKKPVVGRSASKKLLEDHPPETATGAFFSWISDGITAIAAAPAAAPGAGAAVAASPPKPVEPRRKTADEIKREHGRGAAVDAAADAKRKLEERGRKIQELSDKTAELEQESADFEDLATQLRQKMEKKWW